MDTKRLITGMALALLVVFGWQWFISYELKKHPDWRSTPQVAATQPATAPSTQQAMAGQAATAPTTMAAAPTIEATGPSSTQSASSLHVVTTSAASATAPAPAPIQLGYFKLDQDAKATYPVGLSLSAMGAGINSVTLNQFKQAENQGKPYQFQQPYDGFVQATRSLATRSVTVDGQRLDLSAVRWTLEKSTATTAVYSVEVASRTAPLVRLVKTYEIFGRKSQGMGYELLVTLRMENLTDRPLNVSTSWNGPTAPPREISNTDDRQVIGGYWDKDHVAVTAYGLHEFSAKEPTKQLLEDKEHHPLQWAGKSSVYFNAIIRPAPAEGAHAPSWLSAVTATALNPQEEDATKRLVAMTFDTKATTLAAGAAESLPLHVFMGPKRRDILNSPYYSAFGYGETLRTTGAGCFYESICTVGWLVDTMVALLSAFHFVFRDWGLAIIILVVLVRLVLHPITKRSTISMQKMAKLGPEMERLKKKYGDNKEELNKAMMQFYKEHGSTQLLGCLPMLLQTPIWIALWTALRNTFQFRQAPLLYGYTWIHDLASPDRVITFAPTHILFFTISSVNLLPILMAVVFYLQQKYTPRPPAATKEQAQQQKMMAWMSLLFPLMLYTEPSGLNLYILTSTTIGIFESKRIRDHILRKEEEEKAMRVIVDAKPTRASKRRDQDKTPEPKRGLGGWLSNIQERVEAERRRKK